MVNRPSYKAELYKIPNRDINGAGDAGATVVTVGAEATVGLITVTATVPAVGFVMMIVAAPTLEGKSGVTMGAGTEG